MGQLTERVKELEATIKVNGEVDSECFAEIFEDLDELETKLDATQTSLRELSTRIKILETEKQSESACANRFYSLTFGTL